MKSPIVALSMLLGLQLGSTAQAAELMATHRQDLKRNIMK